MKAYRVVVSLYVAFCSCSGENTIEEKFFISKESAEAEYKKQIDSTREWIIKEIIDEYQDEDSRPCRNAFTESENDSGHYFEIQNPYEDIETYQVYMCEIEIQ